MRPGLCIDKLKRFADLCLRHEREDYFETAAQLARTYRLTDAELQALNALLKKAGDDRYFYYVECRPKRRRQSRRAASAVGYYHDVKRKEKRK